MNLDVIPIVYDTFDSGILNPTKWTITQDPEGQQLTEEYGVKNSVFYAENDSSADRRTILNMNYTFHSGESLDYDLDYIFGSGNRAMVIYFNGQALDRYLGYGLGQDWSGSVGYNGKEFDIGNTNGKYHINLDFTNTGFDLEVLRPDSSVYNKSIPISSNTFNMGFETWSNGSIRAEYDNFVLNGASVPEVSSLALISLGAAGLYKLKKNQVQKKFKRVK